MKSRYNRLMVWLAHKLNRLSVVLLSRHDGDFADAMTNPPPPDMPKLDRVLSIVHSAITTQAFQSGGPDGQRTMELTVDCDDDPLLKSVLEMKGGQLGIIIHLAAPTPITNNALAAQMLQMRAMAGVTVPDHPV